MRSLSRFIAPWLFSVTYDELIITLHYVSLEYADTVRPDFFRETGIHPAGEIFLDFFPHEECREATLAVFPFVLYKHGRPSRALTDDHWEMWHGNLLAISLN